LSLAVRGVFWLGVYLAVGILPLIFAALSQPTGRGFVAELSIALGFVGLSIMGTQFALVPRLRAVAAPFGEDAVVQFHRQVSYVATGFILAHPVLLLVGKAYTAVLLNPFQAPWRARFALAATFCLLAVMVTSIWRRKLRLTYEVWQALHALLATAAVVLALAHIALVGHYVDTLWTGVLWVVMAAGLLGLLVWVRLVKPFMRLRRPWEVERITRERGNTWTVLLRPLGHRGLEFSPGQFGWIMIDRSPFALTSHPFSFSASAESDGRAAISIKALGDFTSTVHRLRPGTRAYIDGPHGAFTPDRHEGPGFMLIGGGVGITPLISMLRTFADRADPRPCVLFYAHRTLEDATFQEEIDQLARRLTLAVVHVVEYPPDDWRGEQGRITEDVLRRHLPYRYERMQYFVCGPPPMLDSVAKTLKSLGVPVARIHTERFSFV
jgi:predicted ferric reductase